MIDQLISLFVYYFIRGCEWGWSNPLFAIIIVMGISWGILSLFVKVEDSVM